MLSNVSESTNAVALSFLDKQPPLTTYRNVRSLLNKAFESNDECLNDPNYRCEMLFTADIVCELIMQLSLIHCKNILNE